MKETELDVYDVFQSSNGNLFIKLSDDYSIAIGQKGKHNPLEDWDELNRTQFVKINSKIDVKLIGRLKFFS